MIPISDFISAWSGCHFGALDSPPWIVTGNASELIRTALSALDDGAYEIDGDVAVHRSAKIETGAVLKGPLIVGQKCFVANSAYLRGGVFLSNDCSIGPACEVKSTFIFDGSSVAHMSFVGDSIIGSRVNIEAGAIVANHRNEMDDKEIKLSWRGAVLLTGHDKFGALIGDDVKLGANSVVAPGALLKPGFKLARLGQVDQYPHR